MSTTADEIRQAVTRLEQGLLIGIKEVESRHGVVIKSVNLHHERAVGDRVGRTVIVHMEVEI